MFRERQSSGVWRLARWPLVIVLTVFFFFLVGISAVRETYQGWRVDADIQELEARVHELEGRKTHLMQAIERLNSEDGIDKEARARLGLRKPGERVFVLPITATQTAMSPFVNVDPRSSTSSESLSNPQKWFRYFFPK